MSAMLSSIQNFIYETDARSKPRKNFIQENMRRIRQIEVESKQKSKVTLPKSQVKKPGTKRRLQAYKIGGGALDDIYENVILSSNSGYQLPVTPPTEVESTQKNQGCQTLSNPKEAYKEGAIIFSRARSSTPPIPYGMKNTSIQVDGIRAFNYRTIESTQVPLKEDGKIDYVRLNAIIPLKKKVTKEKSDPMLAPPTYQRGIVPKYLREAKKQQIEEVQKKGLVEILNENDEPEDLIYLTEEEKKEHIRKMRKAYANLVSELSVSQTITKREEIERALKSIEVGIKMFSRSKLYVKATT